MNKRRRERFDGGRPEARTRKAWIATRAARGYSGAVTARRQPGRGESISYTPGTSGSAVVMLKRKAAVRSWILSAYRG